jgi:hypothetical protein
MTKKIEKKQIIKKDFFNTSKIPKRSTYFKKNFKLFINEVFSRVPSENAYDYIDYKLGRLATSVGLEKREPCYQIKPALTEMLEKKVSRNSILDLVRVAQSDIIYDLLQIIEGADIDNCPWGLYFNDESGNPTYKIMVDEISHSDGDEFLSREEKKKLKEKKANKKLSKKSKTIISKKNK